VTSERRKADVMSTKGIRAERVGDVEALLRRTLLLVGRLALKSKRKVFPWQVAQWEQELAYCLEDLNDMQTTIACDSSEAEENHVST